MVSRVLSDRAGQAGVLGFVGVAVILLGVVLDSWRIAALGAALALVVALVMLSKALMVVRRPMRTAPSEPSPEAAVSSSTSSVDHGSGLLDELRLAGVVEQSVRRLGLAETVAHRVSIAHAAERREQADLVRLVTRHDTSPALPLDVRVSATTLMAAATAVHEQQPGRVLVVGPGVAALWLVRSVTDGGGTVDIACDPSEEAAVAEMIRHRGLSDTVRPRSCPQQVPEANAAVRPWVDLSGLTDTYDLVLVLPRDAKEARAAAPALDMVLDRLAPSGALFVAGPSGPDLLGRAWAARAELTVVGREEGPLAADGISRDDAVLLQRSLAIAAEDAKDGVVR